jgi:hypothetical protein
MINLRTLTRLAAPLFLVVAAGCSATDAPTQPAAPTPDAALVGDLLGGVVGTVDQTVDQTLTTVTVVGDILLPGLLSCPTPRSYSASKVIGPAGGVIKVGPHSLTIPRGALASYVTISAVAPKGDIVSVNFEPHGLRFQQPTALTLSYNECGLVNNLPVVVYMDGDRKVLEVLSSVNSGGTRTVTGKLDHFSAYAIATRSAPE